MKIKTTPIKLPEKRKLIGKTSIVPELLAQIPKGQMYELINGTEIELPSGTHKLNTGSVRGYIKKQQKNGKLQEWTVQSETIIDHTKPNHKNEKLYIAHETPKPNKNEEN